MAPQYMSVLGLLTLLRANVHMIAEPSKICHVLLPRVIEHAFGRHQPSVRRAVRGHANQCSPRGASSTRLDMVDCVTLAADHVLTPHAVTFALAEVGMWPVDRSKIPDEELSKGADNVVRDVDFELLVRWLMPVLHKVLSCAIIVRGTLSPAGRATV